jgi:hypothetical protein
MSARARQFRSDTFKPETFVVVCSLLEFASTERGGEVGCRDNASESRNMYIHIALIALCWLTAFRGPLGSYRSGHTNSNRLGSLENRNRRVDRRRFDVDGASRRGRTMKIAAKYALCLLLALQTKVLAQSNTLPSTEQFMNIIAVCGAGSSFSRQGNFEATAKNIYEAERTQGKSAVDILANIIDQLPADQRLEAYKFYIGCVKSQTSGQINTPEPRLKVTASIDENSFCRTSDLECKPVATAFALVIKNEGECVGKNLIINVELGGIDRVDPDILKQAMHMGEFAPLNTFGFVSPSVDITAAFDAGELSYRFTIPIISPHQQALYRIWRSKSGLLFFDVSLASETISFSKRVICDFSGRQYVQCKGDIIDIAS